MERLRGLAVIRSVKIERMHGRLERKVGREPVDAASAVIRINGLGTELVWAAYQQGAIAVSKTEPVP